MAKEVSTINRSTFADSFSRTMGQPLDADSIFTSLKDAENYAQGKDENGTQKNTAAYVGQYIAVKTGSGTDQDPYKYLGYIIADAKGNLRELAYKDQTLSINGGAVADYVYITSTKNIDVTADSAINTDAPFKIYSEISDEKTALLIDSNEIQTTIKKDTGNPPNNILYLNRTHGDVQIGTNTKVANGGLYTKFISIDETSSNITVKNSKASPVTSVTIATNGNISATGTINGATITSTTKDGTTTTSFNGVIIEDGNITVGTNKTITAGTFNASSDARLKENFQPLKIEKSILDLPTYKFDFINGSKNQIGCKAQDLQEICPEIVNEGNDGYLSIQESKIVYLLLEEVKKLRKEIDELKGFDYGF